MLILIVWTVCLVLCAAQRLFVDRLILLECLSLIMKALGSLDKSRHTDTLTLCHITEDLNLQHHCCENVQCGSVIMEKQYVL
jgi:hypothetical protein